MALWQVTSFRWKKEVSAEDQERILTQFTRLGEACGGANAGVAFHTVGRNLCDRQRDKPKADFIQVTIFNWPEDRAAWGKAPAHNAMVDVLKVSTDWDAPLVFEGPSRINY
jgi:hypothetical protein